MEEIKALMMLTLALGLLYGATRPIKRGTKPKITRVIDESMEIRKKISKC